MSTPTSTDSVASQGNDSGHGPTQDRGASEFDSFLGDFQPNKGPSGGGNAAGASGAEAATAAGAGDGRLPSKPASAAAAPSSGGTSAGGEASTATNQPASAASSGVAGQTSADPSAMVQQIVEATLRGHAQAQAATRQAPQQQQVEKPLSDAEFAAKYQLPVVDAKFMQILHGSDPAAAASALQNLLYSAVRSGLLMGNDATAKQFQTLRSDYDPHISSWKAEQERRRDEAAFDGFMKSNPDLKGEEALVLEMKDAVLARIQNGSFKPKDQTEAFKAIADSARALVARMNKQTTTTNGVQQSTQQTSTRQMAAASSAGQSGSGQPAKKSDEEQIFGADWH